MTLTSCVLKGTLAVLQSTNWRELAWIQLDRLGGSGGFPER